MSAETIAEAGRLASASVTPIDDVRGSADYRSEMVKILVLRALRQLSADAQESGLPKAPPMLWGENGAIVGRGLPGQIVHAPDTPIESRVNGQDLDCRHGSAEVTAALAAR